LQGAKRTHPPAEKYTDKEDTDPNFLPDAIGKRKKRQKQACHKAGLYNKP
jgi:hypothetical protein